MSKIALTKENSIQILNNSVDRGRLMGAFSLKDAYAIKQAKDFFNPDVKDKPTFNSAPDPEIAAINIFLQAVQKAQGHGGEFAFTFDDASLLWEIIEFWIKESGSKAVVDNVRINDAPPDGNEKPRNEDRAIGSGSNGGSSSQLRRRNVSDDLSDDENQPGRTTLAPRSSRSGGKKPELSHIREVE